MLFMNNPEAFKTIIEERRRDNGQHLATLADVTQSLESNRPSKTQSQNRYLSRLVPTS